MFEPWLRSQYRRPRLRAATLLSVVVHLALLSIAGYRTAPPEQTRSTLYNRVYYLPPPNARPQSFYSEEHLQFVETPLPGPAAGAGLRAEAMTGKGDGPPVVLGDLGRDYVTTPDRPLVIGNDSIYTEIQVDSVVERYYWSAAPQYPQDLLEKNIQGSVRVQYIVDSTGHADTASFRVLRATNAGFVRAVRLALPDMRFSPARIGERHVSQIVQQDFSFKIQEPLPPRRVAEHKRST